jgi:hypothetical protein
MKFVALRSMRAGLSARTSRVFCRARIDESKRNPPESRRFGAGKRLGRPTDELIARSPVRRRWPQFLAVRIHSRRRLCFYQIPESIVQVTRASVPAAVADSAAILLIRAMGTKIGLDHDLGSLGERDHVRRADTYCWT